MKKFILFFGSIVLLASCSLTQKTSKTVSVNPRVVSTYQSADLAVSEQLVTGTTDGMSTKKYLTSSLSDCESYAIANALENNRADVLLEPKFTYSYRNGKLLKVTVVGYPGTYKSFRKATAEEIDPMVKYAVPVKDIKTVIVAPVRVK